MKVFQPDSSQPKGWFTGPWDSDLEVAIGFANTGVDEPHYHATSAETYLIARGCAILQVEDREIAVSPGQVVVVEPGETHTFIESSDDYYHFVIQTPGLQGEAAIHDKVAQSFSLCAPTL